jgi:hypothetical protein
LFTPDPNASLRSGTGLQSVIQAADRGLAAGKGFDLQLIDAHIEVFPGDRGHIFLKQAGVGRFISGQVEICQEVQVFAEAVGSFYVSIGDFEIRIVPVSVVLVMTAYPYWPVLAASVLR